MKSGLLPVDSKASAKNLTAYNLKQGGLRSKYFIKDRCKGSGLNFIPDF